MPKITRPTRPLADVNVLPRRDGSHEVVVCFMPDPDLLFGGEANAKAFLALDASASLKKMYGYGGPFGGDPNYMQAVARKLGATLTSVTKSGRVFATYWAVSPDGSKVEPIGEFDEDSWPRVPIAGPKKEKWGKGTKLLPAIRLCAEKVAAGADWTIGVIVTDGIIEDERDCVDYCLRLGRELAAGRRKPIKLILIGIGEEVDEAQLQRFDDMFEGTGIDYDLWSHGMVASMQDEADILGVLYGELMTEETVVAPRGQVQDRTGAVLAHWTDGMPGKFRFVLPRGQTTFHIRTPSHAIVQDISEALV
jgi:hypothetical protein